METRRYKAAVGNRRILPLGQRSARCKAAWAAVEEAPANATDSDLYTIYASAMIRSGRAVPPMPSGTQGMWQAVRNAR
jgi:hypothetical protein